MNDLSFTFEWQDPGGAEGTNCATWASLSICVGNVPVTQLLDRRSKSVRTSIFLPLFPLAEWIADNWWFLKSEVARPDAKKRHEFNRRHNLRWAREGYALPSLRLVTLGESVEAEWQALEIADAGIWFLNSGRAVLSLSNFELALIDFVNAVVTRLDDMNLSRTTLHDQWLAIQSADGEEQEFCHFAARLGLDPYVIDSQLETRICDVSSRIRPELLDDFFSLASVDQLATQESALALAAGAIESDTDEVDAIAEVRSRAPAHMEGSNPWEKGYRFAETPRLNLNGRDWKSRSLDELAGYIRIDQLERCSVTRNSLL